MSYDDIDAMMSSAGIDTVAQSLHQEHVLPPPEEPTVDFPMEVTAPPTLHEILSTFTTFDLCQEVALRAINHVGATKLCLLIMMSIILCLLLA